MLDTRPDNGLSSVGSLDMAGHRLEVRLFPVNLGDKALLSHEVLIGF
ncbi:transposase [Acetobacter orientalis]|uniref:Transposase n=1 Tax=Acetobacter orientalis TaxID=146474 RepID=A0A2Z5ZLJ3_9PROT|nr:transposase [Acetobacter orientalis]